MAAFCQNCGFALTTNAPFCPQCGSRTATTPPATPPQPAYQAPPPAPVKSGGGLGKILAIFAIIVVLGVAAVAAGGYYIYHRAKMRIEQVARDNGIPLPSSSASGSVFSPAAARNACDLLNAADVEQITGIPIAKAINTTASGSSASCAYTATEGARDLLAQKAKRGIQAASAEKAGSGADQAMSSVRSLLGAVTAGTDTPILVLAIEYQDGQAIMNAARIASTLGVNSNSTTIPGLGDESYLDPTGTILAVRKGTVCVTLTMSLLPDSKTNGPVLAHKVLSRL